MDYYPTHINVSEEMINAEVNRRLWLQEREIIKGELVRRDVLREIMIAREIASSDAPEIPKLSAPSTMLPTHRSAILDHSQGIFRLNPEIESRRVINMGSSSHVRPFSRNTEAIITKAKASSEVENATTVQVGSSSHVGPFSGNPEGIITKAKASFEVENANIIHLPKPEGNVSGLKRKAVGPWCELCQVSVTSEFALQEHLLGKKHKSREAKKPLLLEGKNYTVEFSKNINCLENLDVSLVEEENLKEDEVPVLPEKSHDVALQVIKNLEDIPEEEVENAPKTSIYPFCSVCKITVTSHIVMDAHLKGKKHLKLSKTSANEVSKIPKDMKVEEVTRQMAEEVGQKFSEKSYDMALQVIKNHEDVPDKNLEDEVPEEKPQEEKKDIDSEDVRDDDMALKKPENVPKTLNNPLWCSVCEIAVGSRIDLDAHTKGKNHAAILLKMSANEVSNNSENIKVEEVTMQQLAEEDGQNFPFWCVICKIGTFSAKEMNDHKTGKEHFSRVLKGQS